MYLFILLFSRSELKQNANSAPIVFHFAIIELYSLGQNILTLKSHFSDLKIWIIKPASWVAVRRHEIIRMRAQCLLYSRCSIKHYLAAKAETNYTGFAQAEAAQIGTGIQEQVVEREEPGKKGLHMRYRFGNLHRAC